MKEQVIPCIVDPRRNCSPECQLFRRSEFNLIQIQRSGTSLEAWRDEMRQIDEDEQETTRNITLRVNYAREEEFLDQCLEFSQVLERNEE